MHVTQLTHDIRNMLQPIDYHVSLLCDRKDNDPLLKRALTVIPSQLDLIQQLLLNVSILANPVELRPRRLELRGCIESQLKRQLEDPLFRGIAISLSGLPEPVHVCLDEYWFPLALEHLLRNAAEAVYDCAGKAVSVVVAVDQKTIRIDIVDSGRGIHRDVSDSLFEPFVSTKNQAGAGFGLAIVRKIAEAHGGTAELAAKDNKTCATLILSAGLADIGS